MSAVLLSLKPEYVPYIFEDKKKIYELRKSLPNLPMPFTVYVYCCKSYDTKTSLPYEGKVVGKFTVNDYECITYTQVMYPSDRELQLSNMSCVNIKFIAEYSKGKNIYAWRITNPVLFEEPLPLNTLQKACTHAGCDDCEYYHLEYPDWSVYWDNYGADSTIRTCLSPNIERAPQSWCYCKVLEI